MKFVIILCLCSLIGVSKAAIGRGDSHNPSNPNKCTISEDLVLSPGEKAKAPHNPCAEITCMEKGRIQVTTCPAEPIPKGCRLRDFVNTNRPFPSCCERSYKCAHQ